MSRRSRREYLVVMQERYQRAGRPEKSRLLDEVCHVCHYHRKHALRKLNGPPLDAPPSRRVRVPRGYTYGAPTISLLKAV